MNEETREDIIKDTLQAKAVSDLGNSISNLSTKMEEGFKGVHARQDTANGRTGTLEKQLLEMRIRFSYNKIIWYSLTTAISIIIALGTYLLTR